MMKWRGSRRGNLTVGVEFCETDGVGAVFTPRPRDASPLAGSCTPVTLMAFIEPTWQHKMSTTISLSTT